MAGQVPRLLLHDAVGVRVMYRSVAIVKGATGAREGAGQLSTDKVTAAVVASSDTQTHTHVAKLSG